MMQSSGNIKMIVQYEGEAIPYEIDGLPVVAEPSEIHPCTIRCHLLPGFVAVGDNWDAAVIAWRELIDLERRRLVVEPR